MTRKKHNYRHQVWKDKRNAENLKGQIGKIKKTYKSEWQKLHRLRNKVRGFFFILLFHSQENNFTDNITMKK